MTVQTKFSFGEMIPNEGVVKGIHIYVSENGIQTERYFLGIDKWVTLKVKVQKLKRFIRREKT